MQLNIFGDNDKASSLAVAAAESINCYTMQRRASLSGDVLVGVSGHSLVSELSGSVMRGAAVSQNLAFFVSGTKLYMMNDQQVVSELGDIPGTGRVSIADDGISVIIANGTSNAFYYNIDTDNFSIVNLPYTGYTVDFINSFIVFSSDDERWFISNVNDSDAFDALDFALAEKDSDEILSVVESNGQLFLFGERTIEPWYYTGDTNFAFAQNTNNVIERGIYGRHAFVKEENVIFFLGDDLAVYMLQGLNLQKISDVSIEGELTRVAADEGYTDLSNAHFISYSENGCKFVQLNVPNRMTRVFNLTTGLWFTRKYWSAETALSNSYVRLRGRQYVGAIDGNIYEMSTNVYKDGDQPLLRLRRTNHISMENMMMNFKKMKFFMDFGTTPVYDNTQGTDPKLMVRWSFDGGNTWRGQRFLPMGKAGQYNNTCITRGCGTSRTRIFEISCSDPVPFNITQVIAEVS